MNLEQHIGIVVSLNYCRHKTELKKMTQSGNYWSQNMLYTG